MQWLDRLQRERTDICMESVGRVWSAALLTDRSCLHFRVRRSRPMVEIQVLVHFRLGLFRWDEPETPAPMRNGRRQPLGRDRSVRSLPTAHAPNRCVAAPGVRPNVLGPSGGWVVR